MLQARAAEVDEAVPQPQLFGRQLGRAGLERRRFALVEDFERLGPQVDFARCELGIDHVRGPGDDFSRDADHVFAAKAAGRCVHLGPFVGIEHDLRLAVAVAEVDEHEPAVVAIPFDPAAQRGRFADVGRTQFAAGFCP